MKSVKNVFGLYFFILLFLVACRQQEVIELSGHTMGTTYHIKIIRSMDQNLTADRLQPSVDSLLEEINQQMSTYRPQSEISQFNRWPDNKPFKVSSEFKEVVKKALEIYRLTDGAFDITVAPLVDLWGFGKRGSKFQPPDSLKVRKVLSRVGSQYLNICGDSALCKSIPDLQIDLSAIAKGYGVDAVAGLLKAKGFRNFLVEIGGEVFASGQRGSRPWRIGVDQPIYGAPFGQQVEAVLELKDCAVATSGDYRNYFEYKGKIYSHEIDPRSGWPVANGLASVTVIAPDCMTGDALATAIMVMGADQGLRLINELKDMEVLIILRNEKGSFKKIESDSLRKYLKVEY